MNESYIISKMNEYMYRLSEKMGTWLEEKLSRLSENWWDDLVFNNLSVLQREQVAAKNIHDIKGLDLAALLRVFDRNWFAITSRYFVNRRERENVQNMMTIRNSWAHINHEEISKEKVIRDVETIIELMQAFDATMKETRDMEAFIINIEDSKDMPERSVNIIEIVPKTVATPTPSENIAIGSAVTLKSDPNKVGAVTGISGDKYTVLIDGKFQTFYKEQIQLLMPESESNQISIERMKSALTAYQINHPGSNNLYSLNSARIDFVPYQFRPALKIIKSDSPRLLIADDVGVGKTIEAGLILKEMEARSHIESVLIICPRPLVAERKWQLEMKRFDEDFTQLDGKELTQAISETDRDGEWPERHKKTIIPYSLFGEDMIMGTESKSEKKKKDIGLNQLDPLPHFDLVIVDEAHTVRNPNTWMYSGVELFCRNADAVVFMTATPLQNSNRDLYTLLNLLRPDIVYDKDTFLTMAEPNQYINALLRTVRSYKDGWQDDAREQINNILSTNWGRNVIQHNPSFEQLFNLIEKPIVTREEKIEAVSLIESLHSFNGMLTRTRRRDIEDFCLRRTLAVKVPFTSSQANLYETLMQFEETSLAMLHGSRNVRFMMCTIMRQAASCIYGLAPFMNDIIKHRMSQIQEDGELYEYETDVSLGESEEAEINALADEIGYLAESLDSKDPKIEKLYEIIDEKQKEENNRVIIFSSFRHTLAYVRKNLQKKGYRVAQVDGSVPDDERFKIRERFLMSRDNEAAVDVLLFSEVGCEGLDYQFCDTMINYDLPWNPMRIEQRIGRIDRRGQVSKTVKIYNLLTEDTIDTVIYDRCLSKIGLFEASIGDCSEILGDISDQILKIMFESGLTEEERQIKIEQMADNEVLKVQEMRKLEQEEKSLYGFDLSNYIQNKDVQDAENNWISPQSINRLVEEFMDDFLGEGDYIRGKDALKSLRLSAEKRQQLLDDLSKIKLVNTNNASKLWIAYLKSNKPQLSVTFDSECAKDNRDVAFLTQMHPLVLEAAQYESNNFPCDIGISIQDDSVPNGTYEFLIYAWRYLGLRPETKLVAISANEAVEKCILSNLPFAVDCQIDFSAHKENIDNLESQHYEKWQSATEAYKKLVSDDCNYRIDQLRQTTTKRESVLRGQLNSAEDERIIRMRTSQLEKLQKDYEIQKQNLEGIVAKADIHFELIVKGVVQIG